MDWAALILVGAHRGRRVCAARDLAKGRGHEPAFVGPHPAGRHPHALRARRDGARPLDRLRRERLEHGRVDRVRAPARRRADRLRDARHVARPAQQARRRRRRSSASRLRSWACTACSQQRRSCSCSWPRRASVRDDLVLGAVRPRAPRGGRGARAFPRAPRPDARAPLGAAVLRRAGSARARRERVARCRLCAVGREPAAVDVRRHLGRRDEGADSRRRRARGAAPVRGARNGGVPARDRADRHGRGQAAPHRGAVPDRGLRAGVALRGRREAQALLRARVGRASPSGSC